MEMTKEEADVRERYDDDEAFKTFCEHPMTKLSLGMIPAADNTDVVRLLLRAAFDAGKARGTGSVMRIVLEGLLKGRSDKDQRTP